MAGAAKGQDILTTGISNVKCVFCARKQRVHVLALRQARESRAVVDVDAGRAVGSATAWSCSTTAAAASSLSTTTSTLATATSATSSTSTAAVRSLLSVASVDPGGSEADLKESLLLASLLALCLLLLRSLEVVVLARRRLGDGDAIAPLRVILTLVGLSRLKSASNLASGGSGLEVVLVGLAVILGLSGSGRSSVLTLGSSRGGIALDKGRGGFATVDLLGGGISETSGLGL